MEVRQDLSTLGSSANLDGRSVRCASTHSHSKFSRATHVVSEDPEIRDAINDTLAEMGLRCIAFSDPDQYLSYARKQEASCLIIDMQLGGISGLDLRRRLHERPLPPTIFVSRTSDPRCIVRAMKEGALEFLVHPVEPDTLSTTVYEALSVDERIRSRYSEIHQLKEKYQTLSRREREVFVLVVDGLLNKQSAATLGISEVTLQIHRGKIMKKMAAKSFAELVRMAVKLRIPHTA